MVLMHADVYSNTLTRSVRLEILLPEFRGGERLKTLYLLHGMTDDQTIWQRRTSIERYADERGIAVVMPSTQLNWYANTHAGERWFDYISDELLLITRRMLPCLSDARADTYAAGLSMGGYGALRCALNRPDRFCAAASLSGGLDAAAVPCLGDPLAESAFWEDVFGPTSEIPGSAHDLFRAAESCEAKPRVFMWCGTEDFLYDQNVRMRDHLRRLGYDLYYRETSGDHQWKYWDREIPNALDWMLYGREAEACR